MATHMKNQAELGFVEESEPFLLKSRFFPSKVGGKPAWLSLNDIPTPDKLSCRLCGKPTSFLLQVYSPVEENPEAFHRTLFIFICGNPSCCKENGSDNLYIYRSQLPRQNDFYSSEPPKEVPLQDEQDASKFQNLCVVCGCSGPKACGKCHKRSYCSKDHQTIDWKAGHNKSCDSASEDVVKRNYKNVLFPELELITEVEETYKEESTEKSDRDRLKEYKDFVKSNLDKDLALSEGVTESELDKMASKETENDKQLRKFKERTSLYPEQVLRYDKGGTPLWIAHEPKPTKIPDCHCGAKRQFEFQVLPQLLSHLNVDQLGASLDWGVLCVYTCSRSCSIGNQYVEEYIFKQDIS